MGNWKKIGLSGWYRVNSGLYLLQNAFNIKKNVVIRKSNLTNIVPFKEKIALLIVISLCLF